jgi:hypothetical protein
MDKKYKSCPPDEIPIGSYFGFFYDPTRGPFLFLKSYVWQRIDNRFAINITENSIFELSSESFSDGNCHFVVFNLEDLSGHITNIGYVLNKVFIVISGEIV